MKFIDLFSGIGGFRLGMEMAGHECAGHCEIDKFADKSYRAMHGVKEGEWFASDITGVKPGELPAAGCYCFGFPCQAFSIAGKRGGFEDCRGTLFFEVMRLAKERKPAVLFAENVASLLNHDGGRTFGIIISTMDGLGYDVEWQVLNSKNFGVPHNRERVFIVGHLRGKCAGKVFPVRETAAENTCGGIPGTETEKNAITPRFIDLNPDGKTTETARCLQARYQKGMAKRHRENSGVAIPVLTPGRAEKRQNGRRVKEDGEPMFTLTGQDRHGVAIYQRPHGYNKGGIHKDAPAITGNSYQENNVLLQDCRIRRLTPRECFRLQGFPDEYFDRAAAVCSDTQLYKQAGNSVTVNVVYEIARRLE